MTESNLQSENLIKLLAGAVAIIMSLVGLLYHKLTEADKEQQTQLDEGQDEFTSLKIKLTEIEKDIASLQEARKDMLKELSEFEIKRMKDHESVVILKDQHFRNHGEKVE